MQSPVGSFNPLQRLFSRPADGPQVEATVKKVEALVDELRDLPVHKLKDEMKELQVCLHSWGNRILFTFV